MSQTETAEKPTRHSLIEDAQGIAYGSFMAAVGVQLLTHLDFVTGQTAGLAILINFAVELLYGLIDPRLRQS